MSAEIGRRADLPLYVHFGTLWGCPRAAPMARTPIRSWSGSYQSCAPGDILAHPFTRHPGGFVNRQGEVHSVIRAAIDRGLKIDVGHGSHFSYRLARKALAAGIVPHTLGADMHGYNTEVPAPAGTPEQHYDDENHPFRGQARFQPDTGDELDDGARAPARRRGADGDLDPAQMLGLTDRLGALKPGFAADVVGAVDDRGRFILRDNENTEVIAERLLRPAFCLRAGKRFDADSPILPQAIAA